MEDIIQKLNHLRIGLSETGMKRNQPDQRKEVATDAPATSRRKEAEEGRLFQTVAKQFWEMVSHEDQEITDKQNILALADDLRALVIAACPSEVDLVKYLARLFEAAVRNLWAVHRYELPHLRVHTADGGVVRTYRGDPHPALDMVRTATVLQRAGDCDALVPELMRYWRDLSEYSKQWLVLVPDRHYHLIRKTILESRLRDDAIVWMVLLAPLRTFEDDWSNLFRLFENSVMDRDARLFDQQFSELRDAVCESLVTEAPALAEVMMRMPVPIDVDCREDHRPNLLAAARNALRVGQSTLAGLILDMFSPTMFTQSARKCLELCGSIMGTACFQGNFDIAKQVLEVTKCSWSDLGQLDLSFGAMARSLYSHEDGSSVPQTYLWGARDPDAHPNAIARRTVFCGGSENFITKVVNDLGPAQTVVSVFGFDSLICQPLFCNWPGGGCDGRGLQHILQNVLKLTDSQCRDVCRAGIITAVENKTCALDVLRLLFHYGFGGAEADDAPFNVPSAAARVALVNGIGKRVHNAFNTRPISSEAYKWIFDVLLPPSSSDHPLPPVQWSHYTRDALPQDVVKVLPYIPSTIDDDEFAAVVSATVQLGTRSDVDELINGDVTGPRFMARLDASWDVLVLIEGAITNANSGVRAVALPPLFMRYKVLLAENLDEIDIYVPLLQSLAKSSNHYPLELLVQTWGVTQFNPTDELMRKLDQSTRDWVMKYVVNQRDT